MNNTRGASRDLLDRTMLVVYTTLQSHGYDAGQFSILSQQRDELFAELAAAVCLPSAWATVQQFNLPRICAICSSAMKGLAYAGAYASAYEGSESICGPK
jgi:hypothetical protein